MDSDSLDGHLDERSLAFMKTLKQRLMEAKSGDPDDMCHSRESCANDYTSFPSCGREVSSLPLSRLVGDVCRLWIRDRPVSH